MGNITGEIDVFNPSYSLIIVESINNHSFVFAKSMVTLD